MVDLLTLRSPEALATDLGARLRHLRLMRNWKRQTLAERSGVSLGSLRRFEETGKVSLSNLLKLAFALHRLDDFDRLLQPPEARSIAELESRIGAKERRRGRL